MVRILDEEPATTEQDVALLESKYALKFPPQYRTWLLQHNGGRPKPATFAYTHGAGQPYTDGSVAWFLAINSKFENLEFAIRSKKIDDQRLPADLLPFARDPFGNVLCIAFTGPNEGQIYFWDHEEEPDTPDYSNCHHIADSFDQFIHALH